MQYQVNLKQSEEGYAVHSKSTNWVLGFIRPPAKIGTDYV
jgi:hypothetical protein